MLGTSETLARAENFYISIRIKSNSEIFEKPLSAVTNGISKTKHVAAITASGSLY